MKSISRNIEKHYPLYVDSWRRLLQHLIIISVMCHHLILWPLPNLYIYTILVTNVH